MAKEKKSARKKAQKETKQRQPLMRREYWMISSIVVLAIVVIGMGGFIIFDKLTTNNNEEIQTSEMAMEELETNESMEEVEIPVQEEVSIEAEIGENISYVGFSPDKIINNPKGYEYTAFASDSKVGISGIYVSEDQRDISLAISWSDLNKIYNVPGHSNAQEYISESYPIHFDQRVVGIYTGGYGQMLGPYYVLFAMEDGSLEYMPLMEAAMTENFASYGTVPGVTNVVDVIEAQVHHDISGWATILARTADGSFIDLMPILTELTK